MNTCTGEQTQNKQLSGRMLVRGSGIRDIAQVLGVSQVWVLHQLELMASNQALQPVKQPYEKQEITVNVMNGSPDF